jgi:hypothetical protein
MKVLWYLPLALLASCSGSGTAPPGYIEACYGGDFGKTLVGQAPLFSGQLNIAESQWPRLTQVLVDISNRRQLKFFKDTRDGPDLRMINVSLCSRDGLFMYADRRIFLDGKGRVIIDNPLTVAVFAYKDRGTWTAFSKELKDALDAEWPGRLTSDPHVQIQLKNSLL